MKGLKREHKEAKQLLIQHKPELDAAARRLIKLVIRQTPKQIQTTLNQ
jgi:hypothetical protein